MAFRYVEKTLYAYRRLVSREEREQVCFVYFLALSVFGFAFIICISLSSLTTFSFFLALHPVGSSFRSSRSPSSGPFRLRSIEARARLARLESIGYDLPLRSFFLLFYFILRFHSILVLLLRQSRSDFSSALFLFEFELSVFF